MWTITTAVLTCVNSSYCIHAAATKSLQLCPTLCNPIDRSPPDFPVPGILQARALVAISFFNAWKWKVKGKSLSHVRLFVTPWTAAYQAPPSMGFSRQEYWSGLPLPSPKNTLQGIKIYCCLGSNSDHLNQNHKGLGHWHLFIKAPPGDFNV